MTFPETHYIFQVVFKLNYIKTRENDQLLTKKHKNKMQAQPNAQFCKTVMFLTYTHSLLKL